MDVTARDWEKTGPTNLQTIYKVFGSWEKFKQEMGEQKTRNFTREELITNYKRIRKELPTIITEKEFNKKSKIFSKNYKKEWGSWTNFLFAMKEESNSPTSKTIPTKEELINKYKKKKKTLGRLPKSSDFQRKTLYHIRYRYENYCEFLDAMKEPQRCRRNSIDKALLASEYLKLKGQRKELSCKEWKQKSKYSEHIIMKTFGSWNNFKDFCAVIENY
jgi:hypothetical protein